MKMNRINCKMFMFNFTFSLFSKVQSKGISFINYYSNEFEFRNILGLDNNCFYINFSALTWRIRNVIIFGWLRTEHYRFAFVFLKRIFRFFQDNFNFHRHLKVLSFFC